VASHLTIMKTMKKTPKTRRAELKLGQFYDECWQSNIYLLWPCNVEQLNAFTGRNFGCQDSLAGEFAGWCVNFKTVRASGQVIALREWRGTPEDIATLTHECFHAAEYILEGKVGHAEATSEVFAYLLGSLVRRCLTVIEENEKKVTSR
jgi:hypothetical protein